MTFGRVFWGKPDPPSATELQEARLRAARSCTKWTELAEVDLVRRGRFLAHVPSDQVFVPYRGIIWDRGVIAFADMAPLRFYVNANKDVIVVERYPRTWTEIVRAQARRAARVGTP